MTLMFITDDPELATYAVASGVDRLFVDMETLGKKERQGHLDTHQVAHTPRDVQRLRQSLPDAEILARVNPWYDGSASEIDAVIEAGADVVMLPMFTTEREVSAFLASVGDRARTSLLLETPQALTRIDDILQHSARIDEIHVGLNDLHLGMKLDFMFELLSGGLVGYLAERIHSAGIRFGFGGIARVGEGAVPAELIIGEHVRLGSTMTILSRTFHQRAESVADLEQALDLTEEIQKVRACVDGFQTASAEELDANRKALSEAVQHVVQRKLQPASF